MTLACSPPLSRTDIPFGYGEMITASRPPDCLTCLGTSTGSNDPARSRSTALGPISASTAHADAVKVHEKYGKNSGHRPVHGGGSSVTGQNLRVGELPVHGG